MEKNETKQNNTGNSLQLLVILKKKKKKASWEALFANIAEP